MFGAVNKNVLCYIKETHVSKNYEIFCQEPMFPEVIKLFTNLSFGCHLKLRFLRVKNSE